MEFFDLLQFTLEAQTGWFSSLASYISSFFSGADIDRNIGPSLYGAEMTIQGAAFMTLGIWAQADIIWYLTETSIGLWAPLLYILAAGGGLVSMALGSPPRNYIWFFMGPALYQFLLGTTVPTHGSAWVVSYVPQDQREVWAAAEIGLRNSSIAARANGTRTQGFFDGQQTFGSNTGTSSGGFSFTNNQAPTGGPNGDGTVDAALMFVWVHDFISYQIQFLTSWTGSYFIGGTDSAALSNNTSIGEGPEQVTESTTGGARRADAYHLLSNLKWEVLDGVSNAWVHNTDLRDVFNTFMASECGDRLSDIIIDANFIAASSSFGNSIPETVLLDHPSVTFTLRGQTIPTPPTLIKLLQPQPGSLVGTFNDFINPTNTGNLQTAIQNGTFSEVSCDTLLWFIVHGFQWEAGHIYHQLTQSEFSGVTPEQVVFSLLYGWDVKVCPGGGPCGAPVPMTLEEQRQFLMQLIFVHLVKNEMQFVERPVDFRTNAASEIVRNSQTNISGVGSRSKFAELYSWALMMPYLQGILLYVLAIAYPFIALMIVVPGFHKTLLTWFTFYLWVKLWDVGFAIVMMMERSIWAMLMNSSNATVVTSQIADMQRHTTMWVQCERTGPINFEDAQSLSCPVPYVLNNPGSIAGSETVTGGLEMITFDNALTLFDQALATSGSLDFGALNGYYIFIMAALYFAVPMVTGQAVLGARSGVASAAGNFAGQPSQEAGRAAGSAATSTFTSNMGAAMSSLDQGTMAKGARTSGLASGALASGNRAMMDELASSAIGTASQNMNQAKDSLAFSKQSFDSALGAGTSGVRAGIDTLDSLNRGAGGGGSKSGKGQSRSGYKSSMNRSLGSGESPVDQPHGAGASAGGGTAGATGGVGDKKGAKGGAGKGFLGGLFNTDDAGRLRDMGHSQVAAAGALAGNEAAQAQVRSMAMMNEAQAGFNINSFGAQSSARGNMAASRMMNAAGQQSASEGLFSTKARVARQLSGTAAAMGALPGSVSAQKGQNWEGMSAIGLHGSKAQSQSWFPAQGYMNKVGQAEKALNSSYGAGYVRSNFQAFSVPGALGQTVGAVARAANGDGPNGGTGAENSARHGGGAIRPGGGAAGKGYGLIKGGSVVPQQNTASQMRGGNFKS